MMLVLFLMGVVVGHAISESKWINNAEEPKRLLIHHHKEHYFYKSVRLDDPESWKMLEIHRGDKETL